MRALGFIVMLLIPFAGSALSQVRSTQSNVFWFDFSTTLPGDSLQIFDALTGDVSGWWDHRMSPSPVALTIDPRPGGAFLEVFDSSGNGVQHAVVTLAHRGKMLRMDGPLGLAGKAVQMVTTLALSSPNPDSTEITVSVHLSGEIDAKTAGIVESVWKHFILKQFTGYVLGNRSRRNR